MNKTVSTLLILTALVNIGCGAGTDDSHSSSPSLDIECSFANASGCDTLNAGKRVYIGLSDELSINCESYLAAITAGNFTQEFDYSSYVDTYEEGGVLKALATHWVNKTWMPVITMPSKTFKVCSYIDLNSNQILDSLEPILDSTLTIGQPFDPLDDWSNY